MERQSRELLSHGGEGNGSPLSVEDSALAQIKESSGKTYNTQSSLSIIIASTFTADPLRQPLLFWIERLDIDADVKVAPYAQVMQELLNPESLMSCNRSGVNILLVRIEDWIRDRPTEPNVEQNIQHVRQVVNDFIAALEVLRKRTNASIFLFLSPLSTVLGGAYREDLDKIQNSLIARARTVHNVHCWTHSDLVRLYPLATYQSLVSDRIGHIPHTNEYFVAVATLLARRLAALVKPPYKVIALDCDNTLWKGICGEDGAAGVELTPSHLKLQQMLVRQYDSGMLLCLCSKNNPSDVEAVFRNRADMPLREEHFISSRVNWSSKSSNLHSLSHELGLALDSFILIDDSALECAEVEAHCHGVLALRLPETAEAVTHFLEHIWAFDRIGVSEEARRRTAQYKENRARSTALGQAVDLQAFLSSLELKIQISPPRPDQLVRVAELVQRTNQFNLTAIRRRAGEIEGLLHTGELSGLVVNVSDRFGDYGLTGVVLYRQRELSLEVDTFLLSCRILGRGVEHRIANELGRIAREERLTSVVLSYCPTPRNEPAREFLESSFAEFRTLPNVEMDPINGGSFTVPAAYAESLSLKISAGKEAEVELEAKSSSGTQEATSSTRWHEFAYRFSRVEDISQEIAQSMRRKRGTGAKYVAPRTPTEAAVAEIWADVLSLDRIGAHDDFFELGGDSLLAVQTLARLGSVLGLEVSLHEFFEGPTVENVAARLTDASEWAPLITPVGRDRRIPLSSAQQRLWFIDRLEESSKAYYISEAVRLRGPLDRKALQSALDALIQRHEVLRTVFMEVDGEPVQEIVTEAQFLLRSIDLSDYEGDLREVELHSQALEESTTPFNLGVGPLIRGRLLQLSETEHVLLIVMHHMISDGWSLGVLIRELGLLYSAHREGRSDPLSPLAIQYGDYAVWQRAWSGGAEIQQQVAYWIEQLRRAPQLLTLPLDRPRAATRSYRGASVSMSLENDLTTNLRILTRRLNLTLAMTLFTAWSIVLSRLSGQDDLVVGIPIANRRRTELEGLVGFFVNTLPVRFRIQSDPAVIDLLQQVKVSMLGAYVHQDAPFEHIVEALQPERSLSHNPVFQVIFVLQSAPRKEIEFSGLTLLEQEFPREMAQFDLLLSLQEAGEKIAGGVNYASDLFDRATIERWIGYLKRVLEQMVREPQRRVSELLLMGEEEQRQVIELFNTTEAACRREMLIHELFEEQVRRTPDTVAAVFEGRSLTYFELNGRANQLARYLRVKGVGEDQRVAICAERSLEMVVAVLGVLKAGAGYVPVDPAYPAARLAYILNDADPGVLLSQRRLKERLPPTAAAVVYLDDDWNAISRYDAHNLHAHPSDARTHSLAYVIYTSGSTGQPKGVLVEHRNVVNHWYALEALYRRPTDCRHIGVNAPFTFDASVQQWVQLLSGCTLFLIPQATRLDATLLIEFLRRNEIDGIDCTPSQLGTWIEGGLLERNRHALRTVLVGGEAIDPALWAVLTECSDLTFYNVYGPTECTVDSTAAYLGARLTSPHIGRPLANTRVYILDGQRRPVPTGMIGEIYVAGAGVSRGYLNRPALTSERFLPDPFGSDVKARLYGTGDLGRWRADGTIEYLGRNDRQVKIRGFRVELGEIEVQLCRYEQVKEAVVVALGEGAGDKRLVAYLILVDRRALDVEALRIHLQAILPEHMVPGAYVMLDSWPLTSSGKLDRQALPSPNPVEHHDMQYEAPCGAVEELLAGIWQELLQIQRVGREESFFELGGHSLLAVKLVFRINQTFGVALGVAALYKSPTIRELAAHIDGNSIADEPVNLAKEAALDEKIVAIHGVVNFPENGILLTGATGFVGRFLLTQLLQDTTATVFCLLRSNSTQQAMHDLRARLMKWDLWKDGFEPRIVPVVGDLSLPRLGIDKTVYESLCEVLDSIYHCATSMNHLETYAMAKPTNVESAKELVKLAARGSPKRINHISTLSIFNKSGGGRQDIATEETPIDHEIHTTSQGYIASKWVSEKIFITANDRGIPCNIFRLGLMWADAQRGRYDELQREYRIFKSALLSGYGIRNYRYESPPTPVDYVARAVVSLANRNHDGGRIFHLSSGPEKITGLFEWCNEAPDASLKLVSYYEWISLIKKLHYAGRSLPAVPLIEYAFSLDEKAFNENRNDERATRTRVDCAQTNQELEDAGIKLPPLDGEMLRVFLEQLCSRDEDLRSSWPGGRRSELSKRRYG